MKSPFAPPTNTIVREVREAKPIEPLQRRPRREFFIFFFEDKTNVPLQILPNEIKRVREPINYPGVVPPNMLPGTELHFIKNAETWQIVNLRFGVGLSLDRATRSYFLRKVV